MADQATLTVTLDDGQVFVDMSCGEDDEMPLLEAIGMLEMAKAILLAPGAER